MNSVLLGCPTLVALRQSRLCLLNILVPIISEMVSIRIADKFARVVGSSFIVYCLLVALCQTKRIKVLYILLKEISFANQFTHFYPHRVMKTEYLLTYFTLRHRYISLAQGHLYSRNIIGG